MGVLNIVANKDPIDIVGIFKLKAQRICIKGNQGLGFYKLLGKS
jgi:hypothetical protein